MNKNKKRKKKRRIGFMILAALLILLICVFFQCSKQDHKESDAAESKLNITTEYEQNVNQITEIDYEKQQETLNQIVEEGKMNVNYSANAVFNGKYSESFNIKNIKNNHNPIVFELYDENRNCIYVSKKIEPGYEMTQIKLEKELSKGVHECRLKVGYAQEGNVASIFPITIEVK